MIQSSGCPPWQPDSVAGPAGHHDDAPLLHHAKGHDRGARHASNTSQKARCSIPGFGGAIGIRTSVQEPQRNLSSDQGVRPCRLNRPSPKLRRESALRRAKTAFVAPAQYQGLCAKVRKTYASRRRSPSGRRVGHAVTGAGEGNPETTHSCGISLQFAYRA
jgi:hypothetical protein